MLRGRSRQVVREQECNENAETPNLDSLMIDRSQSMSSLGALLHCIACRQAGWRLFFFWGKGLQMLGPLGWPEASSEY
jgi:hypothetical protein